GKGPVPSALDILGGTVTYRTGAQTHGVTVDKVPGGRARYSGGGTTIVQLMLEEATGEPFHVLARKHLFEPLCMRRSTFEQPLPERLTSNTAVGHESGKPLPEKWICVPSTAAGAIYTTAGDYARFMIACRDAWRGQPNPILSRRLAEQMMRPEGGEFGLGWEIIGEGLARRFGHGGSNDGYQCESTCFLENGQGAVVMTNADSGLIFYWEVF